MDLTAQLGDLLRDSASAELDHGLLYGTGPPQPDGVVAAAPEASGADLAAALTAAIGSVGDAGGRRDPPRGPALGAGRGARNLRDSTGQMIYPLGFGAAMGVHEVGVPELAAADVLALDATRCWLILTG